MKEHANNCHVQRRESRHKERTSHAAWTAIQVMSEGRNFCSHIANKPGEPPSIEGLRPPLVKQTVFKAERLSSEARLRTSCAKPEQKRVAARHERKVAARNNIRYLTYKDLDRLRTQKSGGALKEIVSSEPQKPPSRAVSRSLLSSLTHLCALPFNSRPPSRPHGAMSETPRLRSAFPNTPRSNPRRSVLHNSARQGFASGQTSSPAAAPSPITRPISVLHGSPPKAGGPVIPLELVDAPSQRLYVVAFYIGLMAWRIYNAWHIEDDLDSTWLFLKWIGIDAAFFVALPAFRIPWMEFSFITTLTLWILHAVANAFLMYKIPIPVMAWIAAILKLAYDRELSISEQRVKPADILHNSSIILGKQIIQILPEGSAVLNPEQLSFCLDQSKTSVELPIQINQTAPISIELWRHDLDTDEDETIVISGKQARQLKRQADKRYPKTDTNTPRTLRYAVSKKGLYRLERVIDESKLDVRRKSFDVAVVQCPQASLLTTSADRCAGDLSRVSLEVRGVPPFKVKYSKRINHQQFTSTVQSIQPADDDDILALDGISNVVVDPRKPHMGWTQSKSVTVDINEALHQNGSWTYTVEEIEDGLGNKIVYDVDSGNDVTTKRRVQSLMVHNRPVVDLVGCDSERYLRARKGAEVDFPVRIRPIGQLHPTDWPLKLRYTFTPETENDIPALEEHVYEISNERQRPQISKAGKYNLESIDSQFCHGDVVEPSSCHLYNPPQPVLSVDREDLFDKCAGNPIGMLANLDFIGTPPFEVRYTVTHRGSAKPKIQQFNSMRGQLEFRERSAGSYVYQIHEIKDAMYPPVSLKGQEFVLKQDIKPPASAIFRDGNNMVEGCLGQPVGISAKLLGEGPWDLDYEIIHAGKRKKFSIRSEADIHDIILPDRSEGGMYSVVLTGVQDTLKCRTPLKEERQIQIRPEQPSAAFGDLDGKRSILALEGKVVKLPLRLKGRSPWSVQIRNLDDGGTPTDHMLRESNAAISVDRPGTYEIVSVHDSCPGLVDPKASAFTVSTIAPPTLSMKDEQVDGETTHKYRKHPVCQGDESVLVLGLSGNPPFEVKYQQKFEPVKGPAAISNKRVSLASTSALINMDTHKAGQYTYIFSELKDERYAHDMQRFTPLTVKQQVYAPPTAKFSNPGKTYGYCKDDASFAGGPEIESESIPIIMIGNAPFSIEIAIFRHGVSTRPEVVRVKDIPSNLYSWKIPRSTLDLGTHTLSIRSVKDSRGCENIIEQDPSSVRIAVSSPPTIIPLESTSDYCVGEHVSFSLSGQAPFEVFYSFQNRERKARVTSNEFKRIAESPGGFLITGISDSAMGNGKCRARKEILKNIHPYPSVKISHGKTMISDIHEGGEVDILFEFTGTPPFEFTFTRSENAKRGRKAQVLETRHDTSNEFSKSIRASEAGTYEVVAIKDKYCAYASPGHASSKGGNGQKLLQY